MEETVIVKKLLEHDDKFEGITKKLFEHDDRFEIVAKKLLEHDEQFILVRQEIGQLRQELLQEFHQGHDEIMVILRRLDQEQIFTTEWIKRIDKRVEKLEKKC